VFTVDAMMALMVGGFFALTAGLVLLCDRLMKGGPERG
jgi:hypothetical protein